MVSCVAFINAFKEQIVVNSWSCNWKCHRAYIGEGTAMHMVQQAQWQKSRDTGMACLAHLSSGTPFFPNLYGNNRNLIELSELITGISFF
jgi:hypothetical protein